MVSSLSSTLKEKNAVLSHHHPKHQEKSEHLAQCSLLQQQRANKQLKTGKDEEKQKEANLYHTKKTEGNLRPKGLV